jgi:hypothetical protein
MKVLCFGLAEFFGSRGSEQGAETKELGDFEIGSEPPGTRTQNRLIKRKLVLGSPSNLRNRGAQTSL